MEPDSILMKAFSMKYGYFEFFVLLFRLTNVSPVFVNLINKVFATELDKFVHFYLDNFLIYNRSFEEHLQHIETVLKKLL